MRCCVPLCEDDSVLHKFPTTNEKQCHVWLERIGDEALVEKELEELQKCYGICDSHFEQGCHESDSEVLIPGALPTLHLPGSRSEEYVGRYTMDFLPDNDESPEALGMIVEGFRDSTHAVNVHIDSEVEEEDLAKRYSTDLSEKRRYESEITIHRPKDIEIVTRYALKFEQESDDEIILKYPNDDDVIKRYSGDAGCRSIGRQMGVCDKGSSTDDCILVECADVFPGIDVSSSVTADFVASSENLNDLEADSNVGRLMYESAHSAIRPHPSSARHESVSEMSESPEDSMSEDEVSEHPSDDEDGIPQDPGELNSVSEEFEDSCYGSVDADEALRALMKPSCSSPRNHSITVYNLCCDKKFLSSISIDSPKKDSMPPRGTTRHRDFLHDLVLNTPLSNSFQGVGDSKRNPFIGKKSRNKNKSKLVSRNDNLLNVIHSLEKIAQTVETQCIEARRSLRKNCSHGNVLRTGVKLKGEVTPLLNTQLSLIKKIRTNVP